VQERVLDRFQWKPAFCVGDDQIDGQHKKIFLLLADLHRDIYDDDSATAVKQTLKALLDYTKVHFSDEEALMRSVAYPDYEPHKALHDALMDKVWGLYMRCNDAEQDLAVEVLVLLNDWLVDHILVKDKKITAYVRQHKA
jgi:hemerythrin